MSGADRFLPAAISMVQEAIKLDKEEKWHEAMNKYMASLERFMVALKYEKNPSRKKVIEERVAGYLKRAEQLKQALAKKQENEKNAAAAPAAVGADGKPEEDKDGEVSKEDKALRGKLAQIVLTAKPNIKWDDVAGLEMAKRSLKETVILPVKFPDLFVGKRKPFGGILLYGPPGTGKSYLAKAVATESDSTFMNVSSSDLVSKWQGESERLVKTMFAMAREKLPTIIFVDEVDSLCSARGDGEAESSRRIKTEFLVQMQGVGKSKNGLLVLGATNIPWDIDAAMRRRFEKRVYIPLPSSYARLYMFYLNLGDIPNMLGDWKDEPVIAYSVDVSKLPGKAPMKLEEVETKVREHLRNVQQPQNVTVTLVKKGSDHDLKTISPGDKIAVSVPNTRPLGDMGEKQLSSLFGDSDGVESKYETKRCVNQYFKSLGDRTEGYSGSDISILVREALMEPVRLCQRSQYFRKDRHGKWHPCRAQDDYAEKMSIYELPKNSLSVPRVTAEDFGSVIKRQRPSVAQEELGEFEKWTAEFGEEGS